jgi:hypothetical protein
MGLKSGEQPRSLTKATDKSSVKLGAGPDAEGKAVSWKEEEPSEHDQDQQVQEKREEAFKRDWRFWTIISTLSVIGILSSLENTVVVTSLSVMVDDLGLGENYIWITNVFFLTG